MRSIKMLRTSSMASSITLSGIVLRCILMLTSPFLVLKMVVLAAGFPPLLAVSAFAFDRELYLSGDPRGKWLPVSSPGPSSHRRGVGAAISDGRGYPITPPVYGGRVKLRQSRLRSRISNPETASGLRSHIVHNRKRYHR